MQSDVARFIHEESADCYATLCHVLVLGKPVVQKGWIMSAAHAIAWKPPCYPLVLIR